MGWWVFLWPSFFLPFFTFTFQFKNFHFSLNFNYCRSDMCESQWASVDESVGITLQQPPLPLVALSCSSATGESGKKEKCEHRIFNSNQVIFLRMHYSLVLVCSPSSVKVKAEKGRMVGCRSTRKGHNFKSETISLGNFLSWVSFFSHFFHLSA